MLSRKLKDAFCAFTTKLTNLSGLQEGFLQTKINTSDYRYKGYLDRSYIYHNLGYIHKR